MRRGVGDRGKMLEWLARFPAPLHRVQGAKKHCHVAFLTLVPFDPIALLRSFAVDILPRLASAGSQMSDVPSESLLPHIAATLSGSSVVAAPIDCHSSVDTTLSGPCRRCWRPRPAKEPRHSRSRNFHVRLLTVRSRGSGVFGSSGSPTPQPLSASQRSRYSLDALPISTARARCRARCSHSSSVASGMSCSPLLQPLAVVDAWLSNSAGDAQICAGRLFFAACLRLRGGGALATPAASPARAGPAEGWTPAPHAWATSWATCSAGATPRMRRGGVCPCERADGTPTTTQSMPVVGMNSGACAFGFHSAGAAACGAPVRAGEDPPGRPPNPPDQHATASRHDSSRQLGPWTRSSSSSLSSSAHTKRLLGDGDAAVSRVDPEIVRLCDGCSSHSGSPTDSLRQAPPGQSGNASARTRCPGEAMASHIAVAALRPSQIA
mmetsp:Transcript_65157/g.176070  ORF Transcript_65157/g.176070 Transcript_65157/m.176070 type:complete len:437 (+) Transcript_65157:90-1400(+)